MTPTLTKIFERFFSTNEKFFTSILDAINSSGYRISKFKKGNFNELTSTASTFHLISGPCSPERASRKLISLLTLKVEH